jgi:hypothetical protein
MLSNICTYDSGFISGKKNAKIPWAKVSSNPTAWIGEECFPSGFQWADPSKIRVGQVFRLLDHWRQRQKDGLSPLIWNPTCELLADMDQLSRDVRNPQQTRTVDSHLTERDGSSSSDEEEDFAAELNKISNDTSDSESPSPQPAHKKAGASTTNRLLHSTQRGAPSSSGIEPCMNLCSSFNLC